MSATTAGNAPGFETTFITRPEMSDEALKALVEKVNGAIAAHKGEVVMSEDWGKRKLAYPIAKEQRGQYTYVVYTGRGDVVTEVERNLRLNEHVLRFLSVNLAKEFDAEEFKKARVAAQAAAKRREEEREARREERAAERRGYGGGYGDRDRGDRDYGSRDSGRDFGGASEAGSEE